MSSGKSNLVDLHVCLHHETEKAYKVSLTGEDEDAVWVPKSVAEMERKGGDQYEMTIPEQTAIDKGLV